MDIFRHGAGTASHHTVKSSPERTGTRPRSARVNSSFSALRAAPLLLLVLSLSAAMAVAGSTYDANRAFAGGAGSAESELQLINDRYMSVQVETDPPILRDDTESVLVSISIIDEDAKPPAPVPGVAYSIAFRSEGAALLEFDAYSQSESSVLRIIPDADGDIQITGDVDSEGVLLAHPDSPPTIRAPLFLEGGMVHMSVVARSIDAEPVDAQDSEFEITFSMGEFIPFSIDVDGARIELVFATYFDRIEGFGYDERQESISATMPFEWDVEVISSIPFVHAEYYIPKTFGAFEDRDILLAVNGIPYFGTVDRSGEDEIVVHFLISASKLLEMREQIPEDDRHGMIFEIEPGKARQKADADASLEAGDTVIITSSQEDWKFYISLTPRGAIVPEQDVSLNIEFRDPATNTIIPQITYDVDVLLDGESAYSEQGREAPDGKDRIGLNFARAGAAIVQLSNINEFSTSGEFAFQVREPRTAEPGDGNRPAGGMQPPAEAAHDVVVEIAPDSAMVGCERTDSCFEPFEAEISRGQTVMWVNLDEQGHTVASGTPGGWVDGMFESQVIGNGMTYSHTFGEQGRFDYFCTLHPWMIGTIIVSDGTEGGGEIDRTTAVIPDWVKSSAQWWSEGLIDDAAFAAALGHLIREGVITLPADTAGYHPGGSAQGPPDDAAEAARAAASIPDWVKSSAQWWSEGLIDDAAFVGSIEWMISSGVIVITSDAAP